MNKGRRQELKRLHYKRRLKIHSAKNGSVKQYVNGNSVPVNCNALHTTGKPCSCIFCSPYKYNRAKDGKFTIDITPTPEEDEKMMEIFRERNFDD